MYPPPLSIHLSQIKHANLFVSSRSSSVPFSLIIDVVFSESSLISLHLQGDLCYVDCSLSNTNNSKNIFLGDALVGIWPSPNVIIFFHSLVY